MTVPNLPLTVRLLRCASPRQVVVSSLPGDRSLLPRKTRPATPSSFPSDAPPTTQRAASEASSSPFPHTQRLKTHRP